MPSCSRFSGLPELNGLGGIAALQNLHPRFFVSADDEASLLIEAQRMEIELTDIRGLGLKVGIVACLSASTHSDAP